MDGTKSLRGMLSQTENRETKRAANGRAPRKSTAVWTAKSDGEGQYSSPPPSPDKKSNRNNPRYRVAAQEAGAELELITDAASAGVKAVLEVCMDFHDGGMEDAASVTDAVDSYGSLVMSEVQTRLKNLQGVWMSQKVARKKATDEKVVAMMAEIRDGRNREQEGAERARDELKATTSMQLGEDIAEQRAELKAGVRAEIAVQFADLGGFPLLRGVAKSALEQRRDDRMAGVQAMQHELERKYEHQRDTEKAALKLHVDKLVEFREAHSHAQTRRMLKLNSQVAIETAQINELKRLLAEQRASNAKKEDSLKQESSRRVAEANESLKIDAIMAEVWRAKQGAALEKMSEEGVAATEARFLLKQLQDSSASAMGENFGGVAPRTRDASPPDGSAGGGGAGLAGMFGKGGKSQGKVHGGGAAGGVAAAFFGGGDAADEIEAAESEAGEIAAALLHKLAEQEAKLMVRLEGGDLTGEERAAVETRLEEIRGAQAKARGAAAGGGGGGLDTSMQAASKLLVMSGDGDGAGLDTSLRQVAVEGGHWQYGGLSPGGGGYGAPHLSADPQSDEAIKRAAAAAAAAALATKAAIAATGAVDSSGLSAQELERRVASLMAAGPPPATPEQALAQLVTAGWDGVAASSSAFDESARQDAYGEKRQSLQDSWESHHRASPRSSPKAGSDEPPFSPVGSDRELGRRRRRSRSVAKQSSSSTRGDPNIDHSVGLSAHLDRTISTRDYGDGVDLIPVCRVESSRELYRGARDCAPPFSPEPSRNDAGRAGRALERRGMRTTTTLMPPPHLSAGSAAGPNPNRSGAAAGRGRAIGSNPNRSNAAPKGGGLAVAPVYDPFMTDGDHTALGMMLLSLSGAAEKDPHWAPPGGGGKARRRGHMRGESRLGAAPPRGVGAWMDMMDHTMSMNATGRSSPGVRAVRSMARMGL